MIREFKTTEHTYRFVCKSYGTRTGFNHYAEMYKDSYPYSIAENTCHYINRTWEHQQFDTCIRGCIGKLISNREETLKNVFKNENGYKVLTAPRKTEFEKYLANDNQIKEYNELINKIK